MTLNQSNRLEFRPKTSNTIGSTANGSGYATHTPTQMYHFPISNRLSIREWYLSVISRLISQKAVWHTTVSHVEHICSINSFIKWLEWIHWYQIEHKHLLRWLLYYSLHTRNLSYLATIVRFWFGHKNFMARFSPHRLRSTLFQFYLFIHFYRAQIHTNIAHSKQTKYGNAEMRTQC